MSVQVEATRLLNRPSKSRKSFNFLKLLSNQRRRELCKVYMLSLFTNHILFIHHSTYAAPFLWHVLTNCLVSPIKCTPKISNILNKQ